MDIRELELIAKKIRISVIRQTYLAKSGHPGGSLSIAEVMAYLFFEEMKINPLNPKEEARDRFVLSKGHSAPALYATLAYRGYFDEIELDYLRKFGHMLQGHPDLKKIPGVDMSSGSLGQGISAACGMAYASKKKRQQYNTYVILGDGELDEGQVWEAADFASRYTLNNLCAFVDNNGLQLSGPVSGMSISERFKSFGWNAITINGHDFYEIKKGIETFHTSDKPMIIVCKTVKGKGVSFMENIVEWHGVAPNKEQYIKAIDELNRVED